AFQMQNKAGSVGFDWQESAKGKQQVWHKLEEELHEFEEVYEQEDGDPERLAEEYGDILFTLVNIGRFLDMRAEEALRMTNKKFRQRFQYIEEQVQKSGSTLKEASL